MHQGIKIWSQGSNIKLFVPKNAVLKKEHTDFIKLNRKQILQHLVSNCVYTKDYDILMLKEQSVQPLLSFSQERLWFMDQYEGGSNAYNIEMTYKLSPVIRLDILEQSIRHIVLRHEILRTLIKKDNEGNSYQLVLDSQQHPIEKVG
ncbi:condensation domain-containing protein [Candidatus Cardinium hertigii]|nr:condensation domain-containing protein [Candidatus Cardinium hertigii]